MNTIRKILGLASLLIVCANGVLFADELDQALNSLDKADAAQTAVPAKNQRAAMYEKSSVSNTSGGKLVDLNASRLAARVDDLERQMAGLSRENRYRDQRISNIERNIDDLQRRHTR